MKMNRRDVFQLVGAFDEAFLVQWCCDKLHRRNTQLLEIDHFFNI